MYKRFLGVLNVVKKIIKLTVPSNLDKFVFHDNQTISDIGFVESEHNPSNILFILETYHFTHLTVFISVDRVDFYNISDGLLSFVFNTADDFIHLLLRSCPFCNKITKFRQYSNFVMLFSESSENLSRMK